MKLNIKGSSFRYTDSWAGINYGFSTHGKVSKYVEWVEDGTGVATVYVDQAMLDGLNENPGVPKIAWVLESRSIKDQWVLIRDNLQVFLDRYDYIFTHNQDLLKLDSKFKFVPGQGSWIKQPNIRAKNKLVSMVSSNKQMCAGHNKRLALVEKFRDQVDLYGKGFKFVENKEEALDDYMFSIAIENDQYETYFTEKLLDCFCTGTIPIYLGAPDIGNYFDMNGVIVLDNDFTVDMLSEEYYNQRINSIKHNLEVAKSMEVLEDYFYDNHLKEIFE